jgi:hypothetical protein
MQNIATILTNANQMGEGNANTAYELGHLHLAPQGHFIGVVQSYYEQGYNNQDYQYQPPGRRLEKEGALVIFPLPPFL